ncbi:nucleotidyltransferase domain-containing protein [Agromyces sp. G08B096]|uniref:Nucleotidyltransferase domain-containing protein n=1 Tax=Agromyces sp. G08B096 TaxID=3156399 RepID=A0AAU7WBP6_9MICO
MQDVYDGLVGRFAAERFPGATSVIVAGSTARGERTPTSDIDLLLLGDDGFLGDGADSLAATFAHEGEAIEVFAYTPEGFDHWARRGVAEWRPVIVRMLLQGRTLRGDRRLDALRGVWAPIMASGPRPAPHEIDLLRYAITDLLDDLADTADPLERRIVADTLLQRVAELALVTNHRWLGAGKHLARELRAWDAERAARLVDPYLAGEVDAFAAAAFAELNAAGGRLHTGFVR